MNEISKKGCFVKTTWAYTVPSSSHVVDWKSIIPFLTTNAKKYRDWLYFYRQGLQLIRGTKVLRDGYGNWYDVTKGPADFILFPKIYDWIKVSQLLCDEKVKPESILPNFDLYSSVPSKKVLGSQTIVKKYKVEEVAKILQKHWK